MERFGAAAISLNEIRLTSADDAAAGSVAMPPRPEAPPLHEFNASFLLLLLSPPNATSAGAAGTLSSFSFRYGPLSRTGFGGGGAAEGLSVSLSDGDSLVAEVRLGGTVLLSRAVGQGLEKDTWMRVRGVGIQ